MEVRFSCIEDGKRLYNVLHSDGATVLFTGTPPQCRRFIEIYQEKVLKARVRTHHRRVDSFQD